jgi:hypothetical protein
MDDINNFIIDIKNFKIEDESLKQEFNEIF